MLDGVTPTSPVHVTIPFWSGHGARDTNATLTLAGRGGAMVVVVVAVAALVYLEKGNCISGDGRGHC